MILTEKDKMVLTPTYHVFDMYTVFQGATQLPISVEAPRYVKGERAVRCPASAPRPRAGRTARCMSRW